jgi:hypothetical protein
LCVFNEVLHHRVLRRLDVEKIALGDFIFAEKDGAKHNGEVLRVHFVLICVRGNAREMF